MTDSLLIKLLWLRQSVLKEKQIVRNNLVKIFQHPEGRTYIVSSTSAHNISCYDFHAIRPRGRYFELSKASLLALVIQSHSPAAMKPEILSPPNRPTYMAEPRCTVAALIRTSLAHRKPSARVAKPFLHVRRSPQFA